MILKKSHFPRHFIAHNYATQSSLNGAAMTQQKAQEALNYCVQIVRERDQENYMAALLMPTGARPRIFSILALNAELAMLRHKIKRHSGLTGIHQLGFWRDSLEIFGQKKNALLPRQPVMVALKAYADPNDLPLFLNLVEARQQTLGDRPFETVAKLEQNCRQLYGSLLQLQLNALHAVERPRTASGDLQAENVEQAVNGMACAVGILTLLRATILLLKDGIVLLPTDLTALHGVSADMAYRGPNSLKSVVRDLCEISSDHLRSARSQTSAVSAHLRPALLTAGLRSDYLLGIFRQNDYNLLDARLHKTHPLASWKLWWRSKRKIF